MDRVITYLADTSEGQSGAPVWRFLPDSGKRCLVAVHNGGCHDLFDGCKPAGGGKHTSNMGVLVTADLLQQIELWKKASIRRRVFAATQQAVAHAVGHRARFVEELKELVRFASVSAQPPHAAEVRGCAAWLAAHLRGIGLENVAVVPTAGHPIVYADWRHARGRPTVLIYGHYDVQPADPLGEWRSPPFEPAVAR